MGRLERQDPTDGWHHITNHAVGNENLFVTDTDRYEFIRLMNEAATRHRVRVIAYCLMGNHFHLVLWCPEAGVSAFMHRLSSIYAREFNLRHARRGALLASRFFNKVIETDAQALATVRYVHRNPLELGIDIRTYPWSSYLAYVGQANAPFVVDETWSSLLGTPEAHRRYVETDSVNEDVLMASGRRSVFRSPPVDLEGSIIGLCDLASELCDVTMEGLLAPRSSVQNDARLAATLVAYESRFGSTEELRWLLGYRSAASLRSAVRRSRIRISRDSNFRELVFELRSAWACDRSSAVS